MFVSCSPSYMYMSSEDKIEISKGLVTIDSTLKWLVILIRAIVPYRTYNLLQLRMNHFSTNAHQIFNGFVIVSIALLGPI